MQIGRNAALNVKLHCQGFVLGNLKLNVKEMFCTIQWMAHDMMEKEIAPFFAKLPLVDHGSWVFTWKKTFHARLQGGYTEPTDKSANRIMAIDLDAAKYDGFLSPLIGNLMELTSLRISKNNFRGPIPETIANLQKLNRLLSSQNLLTGRMPQGIINLSILKY